MKTSAIKTVQSLFNKAIKTVQSLFNKKNVNKLKNNLNKKTISLAVIILFVLITSSYFIKPIFFNYKLGNKKDNTVTILGVIGVELIIMTITAAKRRHT